ncbi:transposase [Planomonospora sp. ID91781]|uniref:IS110 family transposase n=1 Tax=Planomonospora sp. ID91781 TaxID=2738135 RepID=UPI0018C444B0|nr:transposase [Planomonospora sp. ID91781]
MNLTVAPTPVTRCADDEREEVIVGVDTHTEVHVAAVLTIQGALAATRAFPATARGYAELLAWARGHGRLHRAGGEGTSSHGIALTRYLRRHRVQVIEVNRPDRAVRRRRGKTDAIDAENAARAVLSGQVSAVAKSGDGAVEMLRLVKMAKESASKART